MNSRQKKSLRFNIISTIISFFLINLISYYVFTHSIFTNRMFSSNVEREIIQFDRSLFGFLSYYTNGILGDLGNRSFTIRDVDFLNPSLLKLFISIVLTLFIVFIFTTYLENNNLLGWIKSFQKIYLITISTIIIPLIYFITLLGEHGYGLDTPEFFSEIAIFEFIWLTLISTAIVLKKYTTLINLENEKLNAQTWPNPNHKFEDESTSNNESGLHNVSKVLLTLRNSLNWIILVWVFFHFLFMADAIGTLYIRSILFPDLILLLDIIFFTTFLYYFLRLLLDSILIISFDFTPQNYLNYNNDQNLKMGKSFNYMVILASLFLLLSLIVFLFDMIYELRTFSGPIIEGLLYSPFANFERNLPLASANHILGTDNFGYDIFSFLLFTPLPVITASLISFPLRYFISYIIDFDFSSFEYAKIIIIDQFSNLPLFPIIPAIGFGIYIINDGDFISSAFYWGLISSIIFWYKIYDLKFDKSKHNICKIIVLFSVIFYSIFIELLVLGLFYTHWLRINLVSLLERVIFSNFPDIQFGIFWVIIGFIALIITIFGYIRNSAVFR